LSDISIKLFIEFTIIYFICKFRFIIETKTYTETVKISKIVPKELFKDIFVKKGPHYVKDKNGKATFINDEAKEKLKNLISIKYNIPYESIFYTDELPTTQSEPLKYNVVVLPTGDSDVGAQRKDVKGSYLLYH
jgi:hypothetical protein